LSKKRFKQNQDYYRRKIIDLTIQNNNFKNKIKILNNKLKTALADNEKLLKDSSDNEHKFKY